METGAPVSRLLVSNVSKVMFAAMAGEGIPGAVRCYRMAPMTGDYMEFPAHSTAITRMKMSFDENYLFTVGQDGSICVFEIRDRETRNIKRDKETSGLPFGDEIIIKSAEVQELNK
jgi:hypothetical protein